ncbi:hypothetical protein KZP23_05800 [Echinicola marina]|uniref:hypothetical protein n=1 Tax=Echinicola marina TaxID=2859768 RepID=UPI001CF6C804|nr:hypothetical protein [Echinicola marina]UCS94533.1 hypothetical protein KZP23_05800 [Echinicola marina]
MKHFRYLLSIFLLVGLLPNHSQARQLENMEFIRVILEFDIKEGHAKKFEDHLLAWKECYLSNGGQIEWSVFYRMNGEGDNYVFTYIKPNWAAFDEKDEAAGECFNLAELMVSPDVKTSRTHMAKFMPEVSKAPSTGDISVIWATFFKVKPSGYAHFLENINTLSDHIAEVEGDKRVYWYQYQGGGESYPHFFVTQAFSDFASLDQINGVWKNLEEGLEKKKKDELYQQFFEPVTSIYSHIYRRLNEHSHVND